MDLKNVTILVPGRMHPRALDRLGQTFDLVTVPAIDESLIGDALRRRIHGIAVSPAIGGGYLAPAFIDALPKLEIISHFGVGYDGVDAKHAGKKSVMVTNTPDVLNEEVADTALGLLLNTVRELAKAENYLRDGRWVSEGNYRLSRGSLRNRKAGIAGMGRIGQAIARRLAAFGVPVAYHNRRPVEGLELDYYPSLTELASAVDILISVLPGGAATDKLIGAEVFEALGPDGVFINIGRGNSVDEAALAAALQAGTIMAAGLDVFANEPHVIQDLLDASNLTLLPHVGSASVDTRNAMADLVVDNLVSWFRDGKALTPVPETSGVVRG